MRPAKVYRSVHPNQPSAAEAKIGGGELRNVYSDIDGSSGVNSNCNSCVNPLTFQDADMAPAFTEGGKCPVCLWPRGSTRCYH